MKIIVSFSGGKDSQACLIWAVNKYGAKNIKAIFCDTGWEHELTYKHIQETCELMQVELITLYPKLDFVELAKRKGRFPSSMARFCTVDLKIKPMIDWITSQEDSLIIIQGIRAKESASRSKMAQECSYFKEYFNDSIKGLYAKKKVKKWCKRYDASVLRPIFNWTSQGVIDYILDNNQQPCELYRMGASRVGCYPCIMARHSEAKIILNTDDCFDKIKNAESIVGRSFFSPSYIPSRYQSNGEFPSVDDVKKYLNMGDPVSDIFEDEEGYSCMSLYHGLCE